MIIIIYLSGSNFLTDASRRSSWDWEAAERDSEVVLFRERKIVPIQKIKAGLMRFSFLLDMTQPGCIPDPSLLAAILDLVRFLFTSSGYISHFLVLCLIFLIDFSICISKY
jgi:hypothetical protein